MTPYTLRHSGISWALAAGIPPSDVARFAGTSVIMLERVYAHLLSTSTDEASVWATNRPQTRRQEKREAANPLQRSEADDGARTRDTWLGKPVLYQLSYVREAGILAALPRSALRRRCQLGTDSAVAKRRIDACSQVAGQSLEVLVTGELRRPALRGIQPRSHLSQPRSEPLDLFLELLVRVHAVQQQGRVLRIGCIRVDDDR